MLKKEIRTLGLSSRPIGRSKVLFVGIVFRGSLWLDGVFSCTLELGRHGFVRQLARAIKTCSQYQQLHALIFLEDRLPFDSNLTVARFSREIKLPIIVIGGNADSEKSGNCLVPVGGRSVAVKLFGIDCSLARAIYAVTCAHNRRIPEATRVAEMLSKSKSMKP